MSFAEGMSVPLILACQYKGKRPFGVNSILNLYMPTLIEFAKFLLWMWAQTFIPFSSESLLGSSNLSPFLNFSYIVHYILNWCVHYCIMLNSAKWIKVPEQIVALVNWNIKGDIRFGSVRVIWGQEECHICNWHKMSKEQMDRFSMK